METRRERIRCSGVKEEWKAELEKTFPEEKKAIEEYFRLMYSASSFGAAFGLLKVFTSLAVMADYQD